MTPKEGCQILKTRDDPLAVAVSPSESVTGPSFKLSTDVKCTWAAVNDDIGPDKLRQRIEPWLTAPRPIRTPFFAYRFGSHPRRSWNSKEWPIVRYELHPTWYFR